MFASRWTLKAHFILCHFSDVTVKHICSNYCPDSGAEMELLTQDNTAGEEPCETPERSSVEALLDISEENFLKELEPYEYHCYSGWEEAVSKRLALSLPLSYTYQGL